MEGYLSEYRENVNVVAKINTEYSQKLGKEHYMSELSNTLVNALNQFEKFIPIIEDKDVFVEELLLFSRMTIDLFKIVPVELIPTRSIFKKRRILKKSYEENKQNINKVLEQMDKISAIIDENLKKLP